MAVHLTVLVNKRADISYDEFNAYWSENHGQLFLSIPIIKQSLVKYSQFHFNREASEALRVAGMRVAEFDGAAQFWANSLEDLMVVFTDPEYLGVVVADEKKFLDRESFRSVIGHDEVKHEKNTA